MNTFRTALGICIASSTLALADVTTEFTYQGKLTSAGSPASGPHDLRFRLFNAAAGGTQVGSTLCTDDLAITDGLFTVSLDFGDVFSAGDSLFLEIDVRQDAGAGCGDASGFTTLSGRQSMTLAPFAGHALRARTASAADTADTANNATSLGGLSSAFYRSASNLNAGTLLDARLSTNIPRLNGANTFTGVLNITNPSSSLAGIGEGITGLSASNLATGIVNDARLSTNIPRLNGANVFTNPGNIFAGDGAGITGLSASNITTGQFGGAQIADNSIDTFKITPGAIIGSDISDNSIGPTKIQNGAVTSFKLAANAVSGGVGGVLTDGSIGNADLQGSSIASVNIIDGTIAGVDIAPGAIAGGVSGAIADGSIASIDLAADSVGASQIAASAVGNAELAASSVTTTKIAVDAVGNTRLALDSGSLARVSGGAMQSNGTQVGIGGAPLVSHSLYVNGKIRSEVGLDTLGEVRASDIVFQSPFPRITTITPFTFTWIDGGISLGGVDTEYVGEPYLFNNSDVVSTECAAPVTLPDGAIVTMVELFAEDNAVSDNIHILLLRRSLTAAPGGTMASVSTNAAETGVRTFADTTISGPTIDNSANMYYLTLKFEPALATMKFKGAVIHYRVERPLP